MLRVGPFKAGGKEEAAQGFKREKNWGFVDEGGALMIYYALLPCTVVLEFDMGQPDGAALRSRACYDDQAADIQQQTGTPRSAILPPPSFSTQCNPAWHLATTPTRALLASPHL